MSQALLFDAVRDGDKTKCRTLIEAGVDVNAKADVGPIFQWLLTRPLSSLAGPVRIDRIGHAMLRFFFRLQWVRSTCNSF